MPSKPSRSRVKVLGEPLLNLLLTAGALSMCFGAAGCLSSLNKHSVALSAATAPVVDQAASAYRAAEALYDKRVDYEAPARFDDPRAVYDPRKIPPLMSERDVDIRIAVLAALQCYAEKLVELTGGTSSPALDAASKSLGGTLTSFGNTLAPAIGTTLGVETATASIAPPTATASAVSATAAAPLNEGAQKALTTGVEALGMFLNTRKIKKEVPAAIKEMDPHLQSMCEALAGDVDTLRAEEQMDFDIIRTEQRVFIVTAKGLDPEARREQIMKLPGIVREQRNADERLLELREALVKLALTHHALAAAAQGNNPASLNDKLSDLANAGSGLGKFYSSLPSK